MRLLKRAGAFLLCAVFVFSMMIPLGVRAQEESVKTGQKGEITEQSTEGTDGEDVLRQISLSVGDGQETPVFKAGEKTTLTINVMNKGNADAQNVRISPVVESTDKWPFDMNKLNYELDLGTIEAGKQASAVWGSDKDPLTVRSDVTGKSYQLNFKITYDDGQKAYEADKYVFVKTTAAEKPADDGKNENQNPGGSGNGSDGSGSSGTGSGGTSGGMDISGGGVYNSDPMVSGGSGSSGNGSVPRVIVTGFSTNPGEVRAGTNFKLIVHLKNTSKQTAVRNMLFDFQAPAAGTDAAAEAPAFLPVSGSSSIYLDSIPADGTKDISIDLNARADLVQKPYSIR